MQGPSSEEQERKEGLSVDRALLVVIMTQCSIAWEERVSEGLSR